ncbi:MAG TPA: hypothetical protein VI357_25175 [Mycobacteriales bacterium]
MAVSGFAAEFLTPALRSARGAPPGWVADDPLERSGWVEVNAKAAPGGVLAVSRCPG